MIEAVDVLLRQKLDQHKLVTLREARHLAVFQLRQLVRDSDPALTAQIMVASDKRLGTVKDVMLNGQERRPSISMPGIRLAEADELL